MKVLVILLVILLGNGCFAFDIVYPKRHDVTINAKSTFFIGSSEKPLKINGKDVPIHSSGGFAYVVPLNNGENTFVIQDEDKREIYIINKPVVKNLSSVSKLVEYNVEKSFIVINRDSPLRSNPVNAGINRIAHLQRDVLLRVNGEQNGFYRVILDNKKYAWIAKSDAKQINENVGFANFGGYDFIETLQYNTYVFHLDKRVPFELVESDGLVIKIYNVNEHSDNTFVMNVSQKDLCSLIGYSGKYEDNDFVLRIRKPLNINNKKPLKNIKIALDAGHGGSEKGAVGCLGHLEKDITICLTINAFKCFATSL